MYHHECTGCAYAWDDEGRYYSCPWCGEPCSNEEVEPEVREAPKKPRRKK